MKVGDALAAWRERHGRNDDGRSRRWFWVTVGPLRVPVPHPAALHWHDLHHVALGYGPDLVGEMEVSAFELRTGPANVVVLFLCVAEFGSRQSRTNKPRAGPRRRTQELQARPRHSTTVDGVDCR